MPLAGPFTPLIFLHKISKNTSKFLIYHRFRWINLFKHHLETPAAPHETPKNPQNMQLNPHYSLFSALYSLHPGIVFRCFVQTIPRKPKKRDSAGGAGQQKTPLDAASVCP